MSLKLVAGLLTGLAFLASTPGDRSDIQSGSLWVETETRTLRFSVEVAATPEEQSRGLMFRKSMPMDHGMLFTLKPPRKVSFWMKNTYIPLDMFFLASDGTILQISEMTEPLTQDSHRSSSIVSGILELNGGQARALGIRVGAVVRHEFFGNLKDCRSESSQTGESSQMACQQ